MIKRDSEILHGHGCIFTSSGGTRKFSLGSLHGKKKLMSLGGKVPYFPPVLPIHQCGPPLIFEHLKSESYPMSDLAAFVFLVMFWLWPAIGDTRIIQNWIPPCIHLPQKLLKMGCTCKCKGGGVCEYSSTLSGYLFAPCVLQLNCIVIGYNAWIF